MALPADPAACLQRLLDGPEVAGFRLAGKNQRLFPVQRLAGLQYLEVVLAQDVGSVFGEKIVVGVAQHDLGGQLHQLQAGIVHIGVTTVQVFDVNGGIELFEYGQ